MSTGDSLDMTQQDEASIIANDATVKDMEVNYFVLSLIKQAFERLSAPLLAICEIHRFFSFLFFSFLFSLPLPFFFGLEEIYVFID